MSEFHVSSDGNNLTVLSMKTGYAVERPLSKVPPSVIKEVHIKFGITPFKPGWSLEQKNLDMASFIYQWYLYEKSVDMEVREKQLAIAGEIDINLDTLEDNYDPSFENFIQHYRFPDV